MKSIEKNALIKINNEYFLLTDDESQEGQKHKVTNLSNGKEKRINIEEDDFAVVARLSEDVFQNMSDLLQLAIAHADCEDYIKFADSTIEENVDEEEKSALRNGKAYNLETINRIMNYLKSEYGFQDISEVYTRLTVMAKDAEIKAKPQIRE